MRYRITLSYNGADFYGWQVQTLADSVQGCLQRGLNLLLQKETLVVGAGRTDSQVNAIGYVAHFDYEGTLDAEALSYKLNAMLPDSVLIHSIEPAADNFHARYDATRREYSYFLHRRKDPFVGHFSYRYTFPELDVEAMDQAASYMIGRHDFSCFEKSGGNNKTSLCTVFEAGWHTYEPDHVRLLGFPAMAGDYLYFRIAASRFLRNMVRATVGTLLVVGRGKRPPEWVAELIENGKRSDAGESVPGHALFLNNVEY